MSADQKENYWESDPNDAVEEEPTTEEPSEGQEVEISGNPVHWTASEYIHIEKNGLWYVVFVVVVLGLIAADVFILKSYTFSALVVVMAVALIIYIRRPPRTMQYTLSEDHGLYVGERLYNFADFKAFGLIKDGEHHSVMLIPVKRFAPGVSVYFPEESGEQIVDILGTRLPMQTLKLDLIDVIVRQLRL